MGTRTFLTLAFTAAWGCGNGGGGGPADESASGFTDSATGSGPATGISSSAPGTNTSMPTGSPTGYDTVGDGDLRGVLTFTLYPDDAFGGGAVLGMAGAWRDVEVGFDDVDDFFGLYALSLNFPAPPSTADEVEQNGLPTAFEWGPPTDWILAGNALKLESGDASAQACLLYLGGSPTVEFPPGSGTEVANYPLYAATESELQPDGCAPDPAAWLPDADYDIVLYGGDLFDTNSLVGQVHTPAALTVDSPDISELNAPVDQGASLDLAWSGAGADSSRVVIRVWDAQGRLLTANATDDGQYSIAATELAELDPGPITLSIAREQIEDIPFTEGVVKVVTRYDQWAYFDLIEG